ncbi:uncharacterized protein [Nicotiana sylvestris]|uniref:uncharacterized protein n=1 Tax=Nicotiana sylvestris TaxID=4096 RepID=UPI00388CA521
MGDQVELPSASVIATSSPQMGTTASALLDSSYSFYLHPSDSPRMLLVNSPFDGRRYGGWRRRMLIALSTKNKVGFIDGTFLQPKISSNDFKSWTRCNDMVISWLLNSLSKEIAESVLYTKTAKEIWDELEERFGQSSGPQLYHIQKEISESTQGNLDIAGYYTTLKSCRMNWTVWIYANIVPVTAVVVVNSKTTNLNWITDSFSSLWD